MTSPERDPKLSTAYREASRDEPPSHLDHAILIAAQQAIASKSPPKRSATRHPWFAWLAPAGVVCTIVLSSVLVLRQMDEAPLDATSESAATSQTPKSESEPEIKPRQARESVQRPTLPAMTAPTPSAPQAPLADRAIAPEPTVSNEAKSSAGITAKRSAPASIEASTQPDPPTAEAWLDQILALRAQGRHNEADRSLERFRRAHPNVKIPAAALTPAGP